MNNDPLTARDWILAALSAVFTAVVLMAVGAFFMHTYHTATNPTPIPEPVAKKVHYSVHYPGTKGWKPVPFTDRDRISKTKGVELAEFPTLYYVLYFPDGSVKDGDIEYQQWYRIRK